jgi:N-acetylglucosamine-6-phosphate deacetylase
VTPRILTADRVVTGRHDHSPGFIAVEGSQVVDVGPADMGPTDMGSAELGTAEMDAAEGRAGLPPADEHLHGTVLPGFVDQHAHGALGIDFASASADEARLVADFHAARGSTRLVASLATAPLPVLEAAVERLAPLIAEGVLSGIHLEGPYLSPVRRGAHDPALLRLPDLDEVARLIERGDGAVRLVTIAPELPGALDAISWLVSQGVTVALGHSDCTFDTAREAFDRGATVATHLFNGMRPLHHREPGLVGAALDDDRILVELILDGHHVVAPAADLVHRIAPSRLALVSDAMSATGLGDGSYGIGGSPVIVAGGVAMLADGSSLAGSTATVGDALVRLVAEHDVPRDEMVSATSSASATWLGLPAGLERGSRADLVVVDDGARVLRVLRAGRWLER